MTTTTTTTATPSQASPPAGPIDPIGADLTKINIGYGSICGGTDPARLTVDGVDAMPGTTLVPCPVPRVSGTGAGFAAGTAPAGCKGGC